jgi:hypothetical protein
MPIFDLYSKRQKKLRGETPDVFQYEEFPREFRVQVIHILRETLGNPSMSMIDSQATKTYEHIHNVLCREYGLFRLSEEASYPNPDFQTAIFNFLLRCGDCERIIDVVETSFRAVDTLARDPSYEYYSQVKLNPDEAITELNARFLEHGLGFQFEGGEIIRIDSQFVHSEVVKPVLQILQSKMYSGANDEFLQAHEHYRHQRYKECLVECLKAFESTMKAICIKQGWKYNDADTAKNLIEICFQKGLIPNFLKAQFSSLRASLESGVPSVRNKLAGAWTRRTADYSSKLHGILFITFDSNVNFAPSRGQ